MLCGKGSAHRELCRRVRKFSRLTGWSSMGKRAGGKTRQAEGLARAKEQRQRAVCLSGAACPADCGEGDHMYDEARQVDEGHRRSERDFDFTQ